MRKEIISVLMLTLILTSMLGMAFVIRPSSAESSNKGVFAKEGFDTSQSQTPSKSNRVFEANKGAKQERALQNPSQTSSYNDSKWNFNDVNQWGNFTYMDGNKTRLIVGVDGEKSTSLVELERIAAEHQAKIVNTVSFGSHVRAAVVELPLVSVTAFVEETHVAGLANYIEPNMKVQAQFVPDDPYWNLQYGPQKIGADWAWNATVGDSSVLVAVVDTGIDYNHPDLAANYAPLGLDWVNNDPDPKDDFGHGTHCAGIIAAVLNNSVGIAGLAQVRVMAEKVLDQGGSGLFDWVASGIAHATDMGANIISMSLGAYVDSELVHDAVKYAYEHGVLVVAAAGNSNTNTKSYPAAYDEVVAVSATDQYDNKASFSNWGDWIELAAPGVGVYSTMPTYHVTLNDYGYAMNYDYLSGTSMACPHVSGVAALVWSRYPTKTRDWMRLWLRYTADDLGDPGFDVYYGYGRVNARNSVEQVPPAHELIAYALTTPPYVEPGTSGIINASVLNFGGSDETGVTVQLLANDDVVNSTLIDLVSLSSTTVSLAWNPAVEGLYNVTFYVVPVPSEANPENNALSENIYVGFPMKAVVLHSAGNIDGATITSWQVLTSQWYLFGDRMVYIDYTTLNKQDISYEDIAATEADVLIISCAYDPYIGWQFTDSEIEAIKRYVYEGHGLIATAGTFYNMVPNNNKLAPLFGLNETVMWGGTGTDLMHLLNTTHPLFDKVPNPLVFPQVGTALPSDMRWDSNELVGGKYLGLGHYQESAIVTFRGLVYISPWLEVIPPYYHHHLQLLYNALMWSHYQKPQHELAVSLDVPTRLNPGESTLLNATVSNSGLSDETNVKLKLYIDSTMVGEVTIPQLPVDSSYTLSYPWTPTVQTAYNITAYAPPIAGEEFTENNIVGKTVLVLLIAVRNVLVYSDDYAVQLSSRYVIVALNELGINYTYYADDPWGFGSALASQSWDMVVVDHCNYYALGNYWTELDDYVHNGGFLVLSTFDIDGSNSEPTTLWDTMGAHWVSDMWNPEPLYRWLPSHPIFTFPNTVGDLTSYLKGYSDDGDHVTATTGTAIAGFTHSPAVADTAGIVVGNAYRTVLFSFLLDEFRYDQDGDGKLDAVELWENAIVHLARGYEHDLAVNLAAPTFVELGSSVMLNATVQNRGLNNETNVELRLIVNDSISDFASISKLATGESYNLSYVWAPTVEGTYNVTAYAIPVSEEENLANNVKSTDVAVIVFPDILIVADDDASNHVINGTSLPQFESALTLAGYEYMVWSEEANGQPSLEFLKNFKLVIWTCGDCWNWAVDAADAATLELYLAQGGNILLEGEDIGYNHHDDYFMVDVAHAIYQVDSTGAPGLTVTDPTHPVTAGLPSSFYWLINPAYPDGVAPTNGGFEVISYTGTSWTAVTVFDGKIAHIGSVVYYAFPIYCLGQPERDTLVADSVAWLLPHQHDLQVTLDAPPSLEVNTSVVLNATVSNNGLNNETDVKLHLLIDGTPVSSATIPELLVGESYSVNHSWNPTTTGYYNITAYAPPVPEEGYTVNNVATKGVGVFFYRRVYMPHEWVWGGYPMGWHAEDASWEYTLPFDFPFYGVHYSTIYVSSNGLITFINPEFSSDNSVDALAGKLAIAPAWDNWETYDPYDIYIWQNSSHICIRWHVIVSYASGITANFEAILSSDGVIQFNYGDNNGPVSATAGISNGAGHILAEDFTDLNNINTTVFLPYPGEHDVAIIGVQPTTNNVKAGDPVDIAVVAENQGTFTDSFTVTAYAFPPASPLAAGYAASLSTTAVSIINPGPDGKPAEWTAGPPRYLGSSNFIFYSNETTVDSTFFINVTVQNVDCMKGWGTGIIYDSTTLQYVSAWRPTDHVFKPVEDFGWTLIAPGVAIDDYDATHKIVKWGCGYIMDDPTWCFNGTGTLCQIQFKMIEGVNETNPEAATWFTFDPDWTQVFYHPSGMEVPTLGTGRYEYYYYLMPTVPAEYVIGTATVTNLGPGQNVTLTFTWNTTDVKPGDYTIGAEASGVPFETDREDDKFSDGEVTVAPSTVHDVAVTDVKMSSSMVYQGWIAGINVTVANLGNATETFTVALYYDSNLIGTQPVLDLAPNATSTLSFAWNTSDVPPCHNYTIKAVAIAVPGETNTTNNVLFDGSVKVRMRGDINGDDVVSMDDIVQMLNAFGSYSDDIHHSRWDPYADFNQDGKIDMSDIVEALMNFGKKS